MTLESRITRHRYVGNGATAQYPFSFKAWRREQVLVFTGDGTAEQEVSAQCAVELSATGGTVTFPVPPAAGTAVVIRRGMPYVQEDDYRNGARFDGEEVEDRFDQDCAERQDLADGLSRAIVPPETSTKTGAQLWQEMDAARRDAREAASWLQTYAVDRPEGDVSLNSAIAFGSTEPRTLAARFADVASVKDFGAKGDGETDDTAAIQAAVDACAESGRTLFWPHGGYVVSGGIDGLHGVRHSGDGAIAVGEGLSFVPGNTSDAENNLYVNPASGNDENDGLDASRPLRTVQAAIDALQSYGPYLKGQWTVNLAAGTYAKGRFRDAGLQSENFIEFAGPDVGGHPNVPTAIITNGNGHSGNGLFLVNHTSVKCSNIKFVGYNGTVSSTGIYINDGCRIKTLNCHFDKCCVGVRGLEYCIIDVKGGIFENCAYDSNGSPYSSSGAILGDFHGKFSVGTQHAGNLDNGPIFRNNYVGVLAQEHCDGHLDWCTFDGNTTHVRFNILTRINAGGCSFKNATGIGIWLQQYSTIYLNGATLGTGNDANYINYICDSCSTIDVYYATAGTTAPSASDRCIARKVLGLVVQNTSPKKFFETSFLGQLFAEGKSSYAIPKAIRFCVYGTLSGTADAKRVTARFGGTPAAGAVFAAEQEGTFVFNGEIVLNNDPAASQTAYQHTSLHIATCRAQIQTLGKTLDSDFLFDLEAQVDDAADAVAVTGYEVYLSGV